MTLDVIKKRATEALAASEKATPGPWLQDHWGVVNVEIDGKLRQVALATGQAPMHAPLYRDVAEMQDANSAFIAIACTNVPEFTRAVLALAAVVEALPRCSGSWESGSGGHIRTGPCKRFATWGDEEDSIFRFACDEHAAINMRHDSEEELPYAAALRALATPTPKEPKT